MVKRQFTYGGYTFEPRGTFKENGIKDDFKSLTAVCHYITRDENATVADGDEPYKYNEFYKAAGQKEDDIFYCPETGERYVPCHCSLAVLDTEHDYRDVKARIDQRIAQREEHERFIKQEALKNAMNFTEEQHEAFISLDKAIRHCKSIGLDFAVDGNDVYVFRSDLLKDLTENMVSMEGQERIENGLCSIIDSAWDACEGLYANVQE